MCLLSFTLKRHCKMAWLMCLPCQRTLCKFHSSYRLQGKLPLPDTSNAQIPTIRPRFLPSRAGSSSSLRATWLRHAGCFVEFPSGLRALFDPIFEDQYISMGPKRFTPAACKPGDFPALDAVFMSHNHHDHLSYTSVKEAVRMCPQFSQIGDLRGPFDLGLRPIGAYHPRFMYSAVHASPCDAVEIFQNTKLKWCWAFIGAHRY
jgi:hypothetical protein